MASHRFRDNPGIVLPDTNLWLWPFRDGPDLAEAVAAALPGTRLMVADCVLRELELKVAPDAPGALALARRYPVRRLGEGAADELLVEAARGGAMVATNDRELLARLVAEGLPALRPRGRHRLVLTGG